MIAEKDTVTIVIIMKIVVSSNKTLSNFSCIHVKETINKTIFQNLNLELIQSHKISIHVVRCPFKHVSLAVEMLDLNVVKNMIPYKSNLS